MKKLITLLLTLITLTTYSQVIDYNNFNAELIDSLVFVEINDYRKSKVSLF